MKYTLVTATALGVVLAALSPASALAADSNNQLPPEVLKQLKELSQKVQQLEKQVAQQKPAAAVAAPSADVKALDQKVKVLERKQEIADEEAAKAKKETPVVVAGDKGFGLKSPDGNFELKLRGLVQADVRAFDQGIKGQHPYLGDSLANQQAAEGFVDSAQNNFLVRRARPAIEGTLYKQYSFRITPEFGSGSSGTLIDAYVEDAIDPALKVKVGKFVGPLGLERNQSSADTKFNELSLTSDFLPSRDIGVQVGGDLFGGVLNYTVGYFNGAIDGANGDQDSNADKEPQARLFAQPFINQPGALQGLGFGIAASKQDVQGRTANPVTKGLNAGSSEIASYKSIGQETIFSYRKDTSETDTVVQNGQRTRVVPQAHYFYNNFGVIGEQVREKEQVTRVYGAAKNNLRDEQLKNDAWQVTASWAITGEEESLKGLKPKQNFDPANGAWGAWELVARTGRLNFDKDAFEVDGKLPSASNAALYKQTFAEATKSVQAANNWGVGVNWYPNKAVRVSLDYDQTSFNWGGGGSSKNPFDRPDERVVVGRVQASF